MTPRNATPLALAALCAVLAPACKESSRRGVEMRLAPAEAYTAGALDAAKLVDLDTTTAVAVGAPTRLFLKFARPVAATRLKVHGARAVAVTGNGVGSMGPEDAAGWASAEVSGGAIMTLTLELTPTGQGAALDELELWGEGERRGDAEPSVLAERSRRTAAAAAAAGTVGERTRWVADDVLAFPATPGAATLRPRGVVEGEDCVRLRFEAGAAVRGARRAYLAYEANLYRAVELTRSVAGGAPSEALWLGAAPGARTIVDELDPRRLSGADDVLLCLPIEATDAVTLEDPRLVLVADSGANAFDRDARLVLGAAGDGDPSTSSALPAGRIELGLDRTVAIDRADVHLAAGSAVLESVGTLDGSAWSEQGNVSLSAGANALDVSGRRARALALAFQGASPGVAEVAVQGSGVGPRVGAPRIVISYPRLAWSGGQLVGERFGNDALVAGWAESPAGPGTVEIQGAQVGIDGAFGVALKRPAQDGSWVVTLRARFPDGSEAVKTIRFDDDRGAEIAPAVDAAVGLAEDARFGTEDQTAWSTLGAAGGKVTLGTDVTLEAPEGAVSKDTQLGIARKGPEVMPKLDAGMVNVTAPAHFGYRFLPAGQKFAKPVKLSLPYDPDLLPEGMLPEEIQTYYYDDVEKRWLTLPRLSVRRDTRSVVSETTHFTFMINAVLVLPDHPGPVSFNPTSIKELKAADPSAGIDLIEPPTGNGQGSANVAFPIRLPKARGAYQPSFSIAYDSSGANGWLGVGWDVHASSVSIDTRYGVPVYDGEERYVLDGAQLVPVTGGGPCTDGKGGRRYMARVEREFPQIVRCGADSTSYWFEVTDKSGTLYVYGRDPSTRLASYVPRIFGIPRFPPAYDIGQWFLESVVDTNGNLTRFAYQLDHRDGIEDPRYREDFRQMYLSDVWFTGRASRADAAWRSDGPYHVQFTHRDGDRTDLVTSGRLGFKVVTRKLLGAILVEYAGKRVRDYVLEYEAGDFDKSLLTRITARAADGTVFFRHDLEYTRKDVAANGRVAAFAPRIATWDEPDGDDDRAMTSSKDKGAGGHGFVGISIFQPKGSGTIGFALDYNERSSKTDATFLDMNGDGLPDRMFKSGSAWLNRQATPQHGAALVSTSAGRPWDPPLPAQGPAFALQGGQSLGSEKSSVFTGAVQIMGYDVDGNFGGSWTSTRARDLVLDANGDGLPDLVSDGQVWFNQPGCTGAANGLCFQRGVPAPVMQNPVIPIALKPDDPGQAEGPASHARKDSFAPQDVVLEWTAPFQGVVDVSGAIGFVNEVLREGRHDGVRLRIFHATPPYMLWKGPFNLDPDPRHGPWAQVGADVLKFPDDATVTPVAHQIGVEQGDMLYFVLSTLSDFPVSSHDGVLYSPEEVGFAPVVAYLFAPDGAFVDEQRRADLEANGASLYVYDSAADFRVAGDQQLTVTVPRSGRLKVTSILQKYPAADDLVACMRYFAPGAYDVADTACRPADPDRTPFYAELPSAESSTRDASFEKDVEAGATLVFWVRSRFPIDPASVDWTIDGRMTCVDVGADCRAILDGDPQAAALTFRAMPNVPLHVPVAPTSGEWSPYLPDARRAVPFVPPADGTLTFTIAASATYNEGWFKPIREAAIALYTTAPVSIAARSPGELYGSCKIAPYVESGHLRFGCADRRTVRVKRGVPVFFEGHGEVTYLAPFGVSFGVYGLVFDEDDPAAPADPIPPVTVSGPGAPVPLVTWCGEGVRRKLGNAPLLGGGFHGWRYGAWHGTNDEAFQPWVYRSPIETEIPNLSDESNEEILKEFYRNILPPIFRDYESRERTRGRLLGRLAPSLDGTRRGGEPGLRPGVPAWVSQDAAAYVVAGGMNAAKRGARVSGGSDDRTIQSNVGFAASGRSSVGTTLTAGIGIGGVLSLSVSSGESHQEQDLLDLNGDRIPDVISSNGVPDISALDPSGLTSFLGGQGSATGRITDPADFTPKNLLRIPVQPRMNVDVGGQTGLGLTEAVKLLTSKGRVTAVAGRMPSFNGGVGVGLNVSTTVEDLVDVNGDGLPDAVRRNSGCGGFSVRLNLGTSFAQGEDCLQTHGWGTNVLTALAGRLDPTGATNPDGGDDTATGVGIASAILGSSRDPQAIRQVSTVTLQGNVGGGGAIDQYESYGASVSMESSLSSTNVVLADVTGDGLPDFVAKGNSASEFLVMVNEGYGFSQPRRWTAPSWDPGMKPNFQLGLGTGSAGSLLGGFLGSDGIDPVEATGTHSDLPSTGFVFTISFPIAPPSPSPWMQISFGANASLGRTSGVELGLQDIDGDGMADHVLKRRDKEPVAARVNQLGGGNLLKHVKRPMGGSFDVEYARVGNTVDMPESRWTVAKVTVHDGVASGTGHDLVSRYEYEGGVYHRNEREFLGFRTVTQRNADESKVVRTFRTDGLQFKALLVDEAVLDASDRKFVETHNEWSAEVRGLPVDACVRRTPVNLRYSGDLYCAATFAKLDWTERRVFEGEPEARVTSRQSFEEYDAHGNVAKFHDWGDKADPDDDVWATVTYGPKEGKDLHCVGAPTEIVVADHPGERVDDPLRKRSASYDGRCNLVQLRTLAALGVEAVADLEWYPEDHAWAGNLMKFKGPLNHRLERYEVTYEYDDDVGTYVSKTIDIHGYTSTAEYEPSLGEVKRTLDVNGQQTARAFDRFGRLWRVAAPGFTLDAPTIDITYAHDAAVPLALTKNRLPGGGTLDTVVLMDGVGRVIQTKKTAEVWTGPDDETKVGWAVTGHQRFDAMGRVAEQGQTFYSGDLSAAFAVGEPTNPTRLLYDVLGRTAQMVEPSGAVTRFQFGFGSPAGTSSVRRKMTGVDALGKVRVTYQDATDRTVAVEEHVDGRTPTTSYGYDRLGQLVSVIDAAGNPTRAEYDKLGRRTKLDNRDTGVTTFAFDLAGNLVARQDANGAVTNYVYDFERLKEIRYPTARRNVLYEYGPPGASENAAARVTRVDDEVGEETRGYDALGNLARSTRTVDPLRPGDRPRTFTTTFAFDVFGRMLSMVYPDGEVLKYGYDAGGLLASAVGERPPTKHDPAQQETYLAALRHDVFGQRRYQRVGNGVVTKYEYEPLTRRLSWLHAQKPGQRLLQNLTYSYDLVGNVLGVKNTLGEADPSHAGTVEFEYRYDDLHRLVWANGSAKARPRTIDTFTSTFAYSDIHSMTSNVQVHRVLHGGGPGEFPPHTNHALEYQYAGKGPHEATRIGDTWLVYDENGNTVTECRDPADSTCKERPAHLRRYEWTEENRLDAVIDGGGKNATKFLYDADGQRIAKLGRGGESITIGQFWALKGRRAATKHVFAGTTRIASKLLPPPGWDDVPRGTLTTASATTTSDESGCQPSNYQPTKCEVLPGGEPVLNDYYADAKVKPETYYYHPDHLGSTTWVTDQNARVHEHAEYFPYGAVWRDPRSDVGASPVKGQRFLFTAKELDEETGLYYFGARYYDPVRARWSSPDPFLASYLDGAPNGGVLNPMNLALFGYAALNPILFLDPDGRASNWNRFMGGVRLVGGFMEAMAGATLATTTGVTGVGAVAGAIVFVHGADVAAAGLRQLISGEEESTVTSQTMQAAGVSKETAERIDTAISVVGSVGASAATSMLRGAASAAAGAAPAGFGGLSRAGEFGFKSYGQLTKVLEGTGLKAHHLIEKRFAAVFGERVRDMLSVAVTKGEHQVFTNAWRKLIPYGAGTAKASKEQVLNAAREIYKNYPAILEALGL